MQGPNPGRMSEGGRRLLTQLEGTEHRAYQDVAGLWTIGVGHLLTREELDTGELVTGAEWRDGLSDAQVDELLQHDLQRFEACVYENCRVLLSQNQFDALVCFAFNIGCGAFEESTLLRKLNDGEYAEVPKEMKRWNRAGGRVVQGLVNRREKEAALFLT